MARPFPISLKPIGRQPLTSSVINDTPLQDLLNQLHDPNMSLFHNCEELFNSDEKRLTEFPITINSPFYFLQEKNENAQNLVIQKLTFHNGNNSREVRQDGRVIHACLSSFFRGPWRLIHQGHLININDLPPLGDIYVEQKTENFIDIEITSPDLLGSIIFELPKTATVSDIYTRLKMRYGIEGRYLFKNGLPIDGSIANHINESGFLVLMLLTYPGVAVNHRGHGLIRYGFPYRNATIYDLKKLIRIQKKVPTPWQQLYHRGSVCYDNDLIFDIVKSENDILEFSIERGDTFQISVNGEFVDAQWDFSIADLRTMVGISSPCRTFLGVYPYDPSITVGNALFKANQSIDAWVESTFRIFIYDTFTHQKQEFLVQPGENIRNLRVRLSSIRKLDIDSFKLIFMGTPLRDDQTFHGTRIGKDATINIVK
ncbi:hypothetical protein TRFO_07971 [Tritrichomonas foetus]|uniref:Ubiquitin-like domain-containing protein n=1 Tax=Tritrichomonas foetus TaxID=1144522 RepID=A0A1J4JS19_9EUKA|nr:hypothetical protein TRFO_07971 [Tritrichomonas foetus]|eukprot:OHT00308.1 hypothetical protein TRFO_07971 [Tritrichomonas foetus]